MALRRDRLHLVRISLHLNLQKLCFCRHLSTELTSRRTLKFASSYAACGVVQQDCSVGIATGNKSYLAETQDLTSTGFWWNLEFPCLWVYTMWLSCFCLCFLMTPFADPLLKLVILRCSLSNALPDRFENSLGCQSCCRCPKTAIWGC